MLDTIFELVFDVSHVLLLLGHVVLLFIVLGSVYLLWDFCWNLIRKLD